MKVHFWSAGGVILILVKLCMGLSGSRSRAQLHWQYRTSILITVTPVM